MEGITARIGSWQPDISGRSLIPGFQAVSFGNSGGTPESKSPPRMSSRLHDLEEALRQSPEDWSLRLRLIEGCVRDDDMDGAKELVRDSPDDAPLPPELQFRLHTLMTQGKAALEPGGDTTDEGGDPLEVTSAPAADSTDVEEPRDTEELEVRSIESDRVESVIDPSEVVPTLESTSEKRADPDPDETEEAGEESTSPSVIEEVGYQKLDLTALREKGRVRWESYEGDLHLESFETTGARHRQVQAAQKVSAFSMALLFHFIFALLVGLVVVSVPRPKPPQLIATVTVPEREIDIIPPKITRATEQKPAAASAAPPNVIGALGPSPVAIPEMENTNAVDVTSLVTGMADAGEGLSFSGDAREMSDVNFFGISAGGKRIVIIIDATREMLVDEKGGMFAYDKVKDEIAAILGGLNRGTRFNLLLYEGKSLVAFADEPIAAMPSNVRLASEWLAPLNRTYEDLGLRSHPGNRLELEEDIEPIAARDLAHYTKAIQKAIEWQASTVFCISGGYRGMGRSPTPEMMEEFAKEREANPGTPGTVDPAARKAWNDAVAKTRQWLAEENAARREKDLPPKVVINFNALVRQVTGATPPRASGGTPGARPPSMPAVTTEDIEKLIQNGVKEHYRGIGMEPPSIHMVVFLGEDEDMNDQTKDHFRNLTRKNRGKFKMLRGLSALEDVTK